VFVVKATVCLLENLDVISDKLTDDDIKSDVLPMIFSTLDSNSLTLQVNIYRSSLSLSHFTLCVWSEVQTADLHMAQLMPLPLTVSCFSKIQIGFTFLVRLTRVVPEKGPLNGCVCVSLSRTLNRVDKP